VAGAQFALGGFLKFYRTRLLATRHGTRGGDSILKFREDMAMVDVSIIQELYQYNRWANDRVFEAVGSLTQAEFTRNLAGSYPSVRDTLTHIVWAEWIWLQRWKGTSPQVVFEPGDFSDVGALRAQWLDVEIERRAFIGTVTTEDLLGLVQYVNRQGQTWRYPLWRQMYHVVNHSTYHRGQLTTMLRQLAAPPIPTDFLVFHDELESRPS
jgi:uncharacterized damage-inducible protein DinB